MSTRVRGSGGIVGAGTDGKESTASAHLSYGPVNLSLLREYYRQQLSDLLAARPGGKALVLDRALEPQLNLICDYDYMKFFKGLGEIEALHHLSDELYSTATQLIYLVKPTISNMRMIAGHILTNKDADKLHTYTVLLTPRKTMLCERELAEQGVWEEIGTIGEFQLELIPFENDLLSLEHDAAFRELYLDGDTTCLYSVARSLMKIQTVYGQIPIVKGKGSLSKQVYQLMQRMRTDWPITAIPTGPNAVPPANGTISALLLLDRSLDLLSPMLTPNTYESLIDEIFGIRSNIVELNADIMEGKESNTANPNKKKLLLTNNDGIYGEIRSMPFKQVGTYLHRKAEQIKDTYQDKDKVQSMKEMTQYFQKFKSAHSQQGFLSTHINIAEKIKDRLKDKLFDQRVDIEKNLCEMNEQEQCEEYIESAIARQWPIATIIRLLSIMSLTSGIRSKKYDSFKKDIVQTYGFPTILLLNNMEKLGLYSQQKKGTYSTVKKPLRLIQPQPAIPTIDSDMSYVYKGYAPLLCRLVEQAMKPGWKRMDEIMTMLPGTAFEYRQDGQQETTVHTNNITATNTNTSNTPSTPASTTSTTPVTPTTTASSTAASAIGGLRGLLHKKSKKNVNLDIEQAAPTAATTPDATPSAHSVVDKAGSAASQKQKAVVLVLFLGGCSFAEISALRSLSNRDDHDYFYIVATTKVLSSQQFAASLQEQVYDDDMKKKFLRSIYVIEEHE